MRALYCFCLLLGAMFGMCTAIGQSRIVSLPLNRRQDVSAGSNFIRKAGHNVVVIGNYLYVVGGEISQFVNGELPTGVFTRQVNDTLSIPLNRAWNNATVPITIIPKLKTSAPIFNSPALWVDPSTGTFYMWGGTTWFANTPSDRSLWRFEVDGTGGGAWQTQEPANPRVYTTLVRTASGARTTVKDVGIYLSGYVSSWTDRAFKDTDGTNIPTPGMLSFNMTAKTWSNDSAEAFTADGLFYSGAAVELPFGPNNMAIFLGGQTSARTGYSSTRNPYLPFNNLTFYDPSVKKWYSQTATGSHPSSRGSTCAVGAQSKSGTYEIFLFGGSNEASGTAYDDVYVLTIPGFVWFRADLPSLSPRSSHECTVVGKRQMIAVGGVNLALGYPKIWQDPDPWEQGIAVLDMPTMSWKDGYDPDAGEYDSPQVVKDWYAKNDVSALGWSSPEVKDLFLRNGLPSPNIPSESSLPTPSNTASPNNTASTPNIGPIVGGTVGGLAFLAIVVALFFCLRQRRRRTVDYELAPPHSSGDAPEVHQKHELDASQPPQELDAGHRGVEMSGQSYTDLEILPRDPVVR